MLDPKRALGLLEAGLQNLDQGVTVFDADLKLVFANRRFLELIDLPAERARPGAAFEDILRYNAMRGEYGLGDPEEQVRTRVALAREFKPHTLERRRPNGVFLRVSGAPLPEGGFATIYTDVTEARRREIRLQEKVLETTVDLRRNEERLRLIANGVPAGIAYLDRDQIFGYANARFARAYGATPEGLVGRHAAEVLPAATYSASLPYFQRARQGQIVDFDLDIPLASGLLAVRTILRPESGGAAPRGFYVLSVNVTQAKRAAAALAQAQKLEALDQLSSGIAHDFNNLLTVLFGALVELDASVDDPAARRQLIAPALRAARRGAELTERLLAVARRQPLTPQPVDLVEIARDVAALVKPSLPDGAAFEISAEPAALHAFVDRAQAVTAVLNLAVNARDAIGPGGRVAVSLRRVALDAADAKAAGVAPGGYVELRFEDDGVGMPAWVRDRAFDPFFTTKGEGGGSGLGLAMAQGFVAASKGAMRLETEPGGGARFTALLPAVAEPPERKGAEAAATRPAGLDGRLALLVDDDADVRAALRRDLMSFGLNVLEAATAEEAEALLRAAPEIDLVLSDVAMPGGASGLDLAERVRAFRPDAAVILATGQSARAAGGVARTLQKPIERDALGAALAGALGAARRPAGDRA